MTKNTVLILILGFGCIVGAISSIRLVSLNRKCEIDCRNMIRYYEELSCANSTYMSVSESFFDIHLIKDSLRQVGDTSCFDSLNRVKKKIYDDSQAVFDSLKKKQS